MKCELDNSVECKAKTTDDCEFIWNCLCNRNTRRIDEFEKLFSSTLSHINLLTERVNLLNEIIEKRDNVATELKKELVLIKEQNKILQGVIKNVRTNTES